MQPDQLKTDAGDLVIQPVNHASLILTYQSSIIYFDPVGGGNRYTPFNKPTAIVITHVHPDHFDVPTLQAIGASAKLLIAPQLVIDKLPDDLKAKAKPMKNGDTGTIDDLLIKLPDGSNAGGLKMANGTNSIRTAPFPGTRAKSAALVREQYIKAQEYRDKIARAKGDPDKMPPRDLALEELVEVLDGTHIAIDDDSAVQFEGERFVCVQSDSWASGAAVIFGNDAAKTVEDASAEILDG